MKEQIIRSLFILCIAISSSCATIYKPIDPPSINYSAHDLKDGISLSYKYDVLRNKGNKKYVKKETFSSIKIIAIKITNNLDSTINVGRDMDFYSGNNIAFPMAPENIAHTIKQNPAGYLFYLFLTFSNLYIYDGNDVTVYPTGYILGPGIAFGNLIAASSSNTKLLEELSYYDLTNVDIKSGETKYGIVGFRDVGFQPLSLKFKTN